MKTLVLKISFVILLGCVWEASAQNTTLQLPTTDNNSSFRIRSSDNSNLLKIDACGDFFLKGNFGTGTIPVSGEGTRLMWFPKLAAFRAGYVAGDQWDHINIGAYSFAGGRSSIASGYSSLAIGNFTNATGDYSVSLGMQNYASGEHATAFGFYNIASAYHSTSFGAYNEATGLYSTAFGSHVIASGLNSIAFGSFTTASGNYSTAAGNYASTAGYEGAFSIGDASSTTNVTPAKNNQIVMRFKNGYKFFTDAACTIGAKLMNGDNSWSSISDSTKKENFDEADKEYFLNSLSELKLGSWNYKGQNPAEFRHYGPMAQEIFRYFGKDDYGTIGSDTTLASSDMDGIMMICLQALEERTTQLKIKNNELVILIENLRNENAELKAALNDLTKVKNELSSVKKIVSEIMNKENRSASLVLSNEKREEK